MKYYKFYKIVNGKYELEYINFACTTSSIVSSEGIFPMYPEYTLNISSDSSSKFTYETVIKVKGCYVNIVYNVYHDNNHSDKLIMDTLKFFNNWAEEQVRTIKPKELILNRKRNEKL